MGSVMAEDMSGWFAFQSVQKPVESVIGMEGWLEKPAGKRGPVKIVGDHFELGDGTPIKFWGVNLGNADCRPEKAQGAAWAAWNAKYGVNCVRLHKFIGPGGAGIGAADDSTAFDPAQLDKFDYFTQQIRDNGMYYGFSWIFEHSVRPKDRERLIAYDEIAKAGGNTTRVLVFIAEDVQDLRIEMLKNLLKHQNPYTKLTYAQDPALAFIEFQNEDSIFFYTFQGFAKLDEMPTYKKAFLKRFADFLRGKYGTHEKLVAAWGEKAMNVLEIKDEQLDQNNVMVQSNPWFFSPEGLAQAKERGTERRWLDTAEFLHGVQGAFYRKFKKAIEEAGYHGPLVGSCWTSPAGVPQYYNLHNDYEVGIIDRHNYFGGMEGWRPQPGKFDNASQLDRPGSGLLSIGMMQTANRPFAYSEWTTVFPNEWVIESPAIMAAYGMGLQGWDASYQFASHINEYNGRLWADRTSEPRLWVISTPHQMGLYPALARMVYRGDVKQGEVISTRRVSLQDLREGKPEWMGKEQAKQSGDFKEFSGLLPSQALAAGRVLVEFVDAPRESVFPDVVKFMKENAIVSNTGQLAWYPAQDGQRGYFTVNTEGTKAAVGFLPRNAIALGEVTLQSETPFAGIFLTALDRNADLKTGKRLLLTAIARVRNTGQKISEDGKELLAVGSAPMVMEPVKASVQMRGVKAVRVLDHDGRLTEKTVPVADGRFAIDGAQEKAFYYLVEME